ncbi:MAG: hypothetical protein ACFB0B_18500, partial [Thermonemataceae bacterium]
ILNLTLISLLIVIVLRSLQAQVTEAPITDYSPFSISVNPSYFLLGGYSVKGFYILPKRWSFGIAAEASFELPTFARDQFFDNNDDITVDWDYLVGVEARYRFNDAALDKGLFIQAGLGYEGWTIIADDGAEDQFDNWYGSLGVGYILYPFKKKHFHVGGNYNVVFILNNTEERLVGESSYNIRPVVPPSFLPTLFVGWRF